MEVGCRTGDIWELSSLKDVHVEQTCYLCIMARRTEVSAPQGNRAAHSQDCVEG